MKRLLAAVVGTGFAAPHHVDALRRAGYAEAGVMVGSDVTRTANIARQLGVERWSTDVGAVCNETQIDVVHICTRNDSHAGLARMVLEAGKHLVLEKPIALDGESAAGLVELASRSGKHAMAVLTYRGYPMVRRAREIIANGGIGGLRLVRGGYVQDWLADPTDYNWRVEREIGGASRAVADIGTHWFDTVEFISGQRIDGVFADLATLIPVRVRPLIPQSTFAQDRGHAESFDVQTEDAATILVRFEGGGRGACAISQVSTGLKNAFTIQIDGSEGSLAWDQEVPEQLWLRRRHEAHMVVRDPQGQRPDSGVPPLPAGHPEGWGDALRDLLRHYYAAVAGGLPAEDRRVDYPTLRDGARSIDFVEAALASSASQRWTPINRRTEAIR